jgi:hypothetical protein
MSHKISKVIQETKTKSTVDNFTVNLEKAFEDVIYKIAEEIRHYGSDSVCDFKQEELSNHIIDKFVKD